MKKCLSSILLLAGLALPQARAQDVFSVIDDIDFGTIFFKQGICDMDPATGALTNVTGINTCEESSKGTVGSYVITTSPNVTVTVKLLQRNDAGDGLIFEPTGKMRNISQEVDVPAGIDVQISSGSTGVVRLFVGGRLRLAQDMLPANTYTFSQPVGIEWSITP